MKDSELAKELQDFLRKKDRDMADSVLLGYLSAWISYKDNPRGPVETGEADMTDLKPYISTAATQFAPGNFVTTWNPELGRDAVGVTRAIEDPQEANPRVLVKWLHDLSQEWVRSEYLYLAKA